MRRKPYLMASAVISALALGAVPAWMIADRAAILQDGVEIVLKTEPVDPRDFLRGQYVRLSYPISQLSGSLFHLAEGEILEGDTTIHVRLEEGEDGYWRATEVLTDVKPDDATDRVVWIRGKTLYDIYSATEVAQIEYGIERYYAAEAVAPEIDARMRDGNVTDTVVAVGADGRAQIKALRQGDDIFYTENLF